MLEDFKLKVFMAVSDEGSFTRAARTLGISQPAVSQDIAELEKSVGAALFTRGRGTVALTAAGASFKEYVSRILYWYSAIGDMFGPSGKLVTNRPIRVSADIFCTEHVLPGFLSGLLAASPGLSVKLVADRSEGYDIRFWCGRHIPEMSLEDSMTYIGPLDAAALTSNPAYSGIADLRDLPSGTSLAVWAPYSEMLPPDLAGKVAFESPSPVSLCGLVQASPRMVGLLPRAAAPQGGPMSMPVALPSLQFDLHASASADFASDPAYPIFKTALDISRNNLRFY